MRSMNAGRPSAQRACHSLHCPNSDAKCGAVATGNGLWPGHAPPAPTRHRGVPLPDVPTSHASSPLSRAERAVARTDLACTGSSPSQTISACGHGVRSSRGESHLISSRQKPSKSTRSAASDKLCGLTNSIRLHC